MTEHTETTTETVEIDAETAREIMRTLGVYAARERAEGGNADKIEKLASTVRHEAKSGWQDCTECGWVGTVLDVEDPNRPFLRCTACQNRMMPPEETEA